MLNAYYDGGNKADSTEFKVVTLAGYAATDSIWARIERRWRAVLSKYDAEYMHMKEAISLNGRFSRDSGWTESKVHDCIVDLVSAMNDFKGLPIHGMSCTVLLADYAVAREKYPDIPPVEQICATHCMGMALLWYATIPRANSIGTELQRKSVDFYFDRGEPFCGHALDSWNHKKLRNRDSFRAIRSIVQADMRDVPGLQMADMLAWAYNRPFGRGGYEGMCKSIRAALPEWNFLLKMPEIADIDTDKLLMLKDLNFPPRKAMR